MAKKTPPQIALQVGVKALLQNEEGKYLFMKRAEPFPGEMEAIWDIPGGRITPGETQQEALLREVREETGVTLTSIIGVLGVQDILRVFQKHIVRVTYLAVCKDVHDIKLDPKEHSAYKWMSLNETKDLPLDTYLEPIIKKLQERFE